MTDEYVELVCDDVSHDAVLTDPGVRVLDVAQVVRRLKGLSLWHSKVLVTEVPAVILAACAPRKSLPQPSRPSARREHRRRRENGRSRSFRRAEHSPINSLRAQTRPRSSNKPPARGKPRAGGLIASCYFFLPWFFTASIAAAAASGSR